MLGASDKNSVMGHLLTAGAASAGTAGLSALPALKGAAGGAIGAAVYPAAQAVARIALDPKLGRYYASMLAAAAKEDLPAAKHYFDKLNKELEIETGSPKKAPEKFRFIDRKDRSGP